jgi:4-hydroxybenzoate polyprenyltransferase
MPAFKHYIDTLRPHQWSKNVLCLVPLLLSHRWREWDTLILSLKSVFAFCLASSAVYVINDMLDVSADRLHPSKRKRPLAAGFITMGQASILLLAVLGMLFWQLYAQTAAAMAWIGLYLLAALSYSAVLKRFLALDVVMLSLFYAIRVLYGGAASGIAVTDWTIVFALFVFLTLALIKRISELHLLQETKASRRPYQRADMTVLVAQACASAYTSLLVVALYLHAPEVRALYARHQLLWALLPVIAYWLARLLVIAARGGMHHDPVVFTMMDKASWGVLGISMGILLAAI